MGRGRPRRPRRLREWRVRQDSWRPVRAPVARRRGDHRGKHLRCACRQSWRSGAADSTPRSSASHRREPRDAPLGHLGIEGRSCCSRRGNRRRGGGRGKRSRHDATGSAEALARSCRQRLDRRRGRDDRRRAADAWFAPIETVSNPKPVRARLQGSALLLSCRSRSSPVAVVRRSSTWRESPRIERNRKRDQLARLRSSPMATRPFRA